MLQPGNYDSGLAVSRVKFSKSRQIVLKRRQRKLPNSFETSARDENAFEERVLHPHLPACGSQWHREM